MLENQARRRRPGPVVRFLIDEFDRVTAGLGYETDQDKAEFLGVSPGTLSKIRNGEQQPGARFIAAVRTALPKIPYERFFTEERS